MVIEKYRPLDLCQVEIVSNFSLALFGCNRGQGVTNEKSIHSKVHEAILKRLSQIILPHSPDVRPSLIKSPIKKQKWIICIPWVTFSSQYHDQGAVSGSLFCLEVHLLKHHHPPYNLTN